MWVQLFRQSRHQVQAHSVAREILHVVGAVIPVFYSGLTAVGDGVGAAQGQQRTPEDGGVVVRRVWPRAYLSHTAQPVQSAAASDVEQYGLRLVVGGVPDGNDSGANRAGYPPQKSITQVPRRLFKGTDAVLPLVRRNVHLFHRTRAAVPFRQLPHKLGVIIRLLPPEIVDEVGDVQPESQQSGNVQQHKSQGGGIRAAGDAGQHGVAGAKAEPPGRRQRRRMGSWGVSSQRGLPASSGQRSCTR